MAVLEPYVDEYYLWKYLPSQAASIIFILLFLIFITLHFWRIYQLHNWFCLSFAVGCLCEFIGYAARAAAYSRTSELIPYVIQSLFLVIAPAFFAASIYMTLGRIIRCVKGEHLSVVRIDWLTKTFVIGDVLSLSVQGASSGLTSNTNTAKIGGDIVLSGLFIQILLLGLFFVTAVEFQIRLKKQPTRESCITDAPWRQTLYMIYVISALIFARSIFRVVEYIQGQDGYCLGHEWTLYVFDTVPMFTVAVVFWFWYPGNIRPATEDVERVDLDN
ncbi:MAG: hypothetical protein M1818_000933 [Claussenomyces sp. TS43310]|nr:MAG: hypothetical protein M1818_000933 [Claussenomyces sp. TS43310]